MAGFKPKHISLYSLWAEDVSTTAHFYRDVVGLSLLPHHHHRPAFDLGHDSFLIILKGQPVPAQNSESPNFPLVTFAVEDLAEAVKQLEAHQVSLPWGVENGKESRWVKFHDPAGNIIEFVEFFKPHHN